MTSLQTSVGQLGMVGGKRHSWAPNLRAVEPTASDKMGQRKGNLYVLVELMGKHPSAQTLFRQVVNVVQRVYFESTTDITSALQAAIMEAHYLLQEADARCGISCVVVRKSDLYIAQVAPALVVIALPNVVQLFPISPEASENPLGSRAKPEIGLFRTRVEPPSSVLLAESGWLSRVQPKMLAGAATAPSVASMLDVLQGLGGRSDLSAMAVGLGVPAESPQDEELRATSDWVGALAELKEDDASRLVASDLREGSAEPTGPSRTAADVARDAGKGLAMAGARLAEGAKTLGERMLPEAEEVQRGTSRPKPRRQRRASRWPVILAVVIPVLVAVAAGALWYQQNWERGRQFTSLMDGARAAFEATAASEDEVLIRGQLEDAFARVTQALVLKPADSTAANLQREIRKSLDHVNRVVTLPTLMPLRQFSGTDRDLSRVLLNARSIFVLDRGRDEVYWYQMDPELSDVIQPVGDGPVISKGQQVDQAVVSELADTAWLTAEGAQDRSGLLVLDQSGGLFLNDATGMWEPTHLPMRLPDGWRYPQSTDTYQGNFYVLEPSLNQIYRYTPSGAGYADPPTDYFQGNALVNLGGVVDMVINSEACGGSVFLLFRNGMLTKYLRGSPEALEVVVPDGRLQDTPAFFAGPETCHLYIADAGNSRIVELDANGTFLYQYRLAEGDTLGSVRSLFVDEIGDAYYILTSDALYRTPIPR